MKGRGYGLNTRARLKGILGFALIILAVASIFLWESIGRETLLYKQVLVMAQDVAPHQIVKSDMLGIMKVPRDTMIKDAVLDPNEILGKETASFIPMGLQLSPKLFQDPEMSAGRGKYILAVPSEWIYSYPQTIRRGDEIYFYPFAEDKESVYYAEDGNAGCLSAPAAINRSEGETKNTALISTKVAYVKDSSNCEVVDIKAERMDGSSPVSKIEVVITDEQYQKLKSAYEAGYQFVIMYE